MNFIFYNLFIPCPFENSLRNICKLLVYSCYSIGFTIEFNSVLVELQKKLVFISWCRYLGMVVVICVLTWNLQNFLYVVVYLFKLVETLKTLKILSIFQLSWLYNVVACLVTSNPILKISLMFWFNDLRHSNQSESLFYWESCTPLFLTNQIKIIRKDSKIVWKALNC